MFEMSVECSSAPLSLSSVHCSWWLLCDQAWVCPCHWPGYCHQSAILNWNTIGQWSKLPPPCVHNIQYSHFTPAQPAACNSGQSVHTGPWAARMYPHHGVPSPVSGNLQIEDCLSSVFITIIPPTLLYVGKQNWLYRSSSKIHSWLLFSFNWKIWLTLVLWWGNHNKWKF